MSNDQEFQQFVAQKLTSLEREISDLKRLLNTIKQTTDVALMEQRSRR